MKKLTIEEIHELVEFEDKCGSNNLLQELFASEFAQTGLDVIINKEGFYEIIKGTTLKIKEGEKSC